MALDPPVYYRVHRSPPCYLPPWLVRPNPSHEDDNLLLARQAANAEKRDKRLHRIQRILAGLGLSSPIPPLLPRRVPHALPRFSWMITSHHVAEEYANASMYKQSPWHLIVRYMLVGLPWQLENQNELEILKSWREHLLDQKDSPVKRYSGRSSCAHHHRWGRRVIASELSGDVLQPLKGRWLVVAYLLSDSPAWLENANIKDLVSYSNAFCIRARKKSGGGWKLFYEFHRTMDKPVYSQFTFRPGTPRWNYIPRGYLTRWDQRLGKCMNNVAPSLLFATHEGP